MRIVHTSDTHTMHDDEIMRRWLSNIDADVFVHSGDFSNGSYEDIKRFLDWTSRLPFKHKVVIPGNHDLFLEKMVANPLLRDAIKYPDTHLLINESVVLDGVKFWGSPYTPEFCNWAFQLYGNKGLSMWAEIPDDTDVLITHGPARGVLDTVSEFKNQPLGCPYLESRITDLLDLKAHLFGHIHGGYGKKLTKGYLALNSSALNEQYKLVNPPQLFEIN